MRYCGLGIFDYTIELLNFQDLKIMPVFDLYAINPALSQMVSDFRGYSAVAGTPEVDTPPLFSRCLSGSRVGRFYCSSQCASRS
jgi:hypothetical protein